MEREGLVCARMSGEARRIFAGGDFGLIFRDHFENDGRFSWVMRVWRTLLVAT